MKRLILILLLALIVSSVSADFGKYTPCRDNTLRLPSYIKSWGAVQRSPCHWSVILPNAGRTWVLSGSSRVPLTITPISGVCEVTTDNLPAPKRPSWRVSAVITVVTPCQFEVSLNTDYAGVYWIFNLSEAQ